MCGVIVVDAGRSWPTNLGGDAYILIIALDIIIIIRSSINCPTVICLPTVCYFSREVTSEIYSPPGLLFIIFALIYIFIHFYFQIYYPKNPKIPCCTFLLFIYFMFYRDLFIQSTTIFIPSTWQFLALLPEVGLTTPHTRLVARIVICVQVPFT